MAHALGRRARGPAARAASTRRRRRPSTPWSRAASRTSRSPISPAAAPSGRSSSRSAPACSIPRPDSETPDRGGGRAFRRCAGRSASSISAPARARCCSPRSTNGRRRRGLGVDASEDGARLCPPQRASPRAEFRLGDWGEGLDERFDLILCNPPYVEAGADLPPDVAAGSRPPRSMPAPTGSTPIAALAPQLRPPARAGRHRLPRDRRRPGARRCARSSPPRVSR